LAVKHTTEGTSMKALSRGIGLLAALSAGAPMLSVAAENYRIRHPPLGQLTGELAGLVPEPGFFGTAAVSFAEVRGVVDNHGKPLPVAPRTIPLRTSAPTGGAVRDGAFTLQIPAGAVELHQSSTQLNVIAGYATHPNFAGGQLVFRANLPWTEHRRSFGTVQSAGGVVPVPSAPLPLAAIGAVQAVAAATQAQLQAAQAATAATQNLAVSGIGDLELSAAWLRVVEPLQLAAAVTMHLPTGSYDSTRGPNPGFGRFRTLQVGAAASTRLDPWVLAGRFSWGTNSTNRSTSVRSADFLAVEGAFSRSAGPWSAGFSLLSLHQLENDTLAGVELPDSRYRIYAAGPFLTYRPKSSGPSISAQFNRTFGERSALVINTLQLRLVQPLR
jgi:hypothetical protein